MCRRCDREIRQVLKQAYKSIREMSAEIANNSKNYTKLDDPYMLELDRYFKRADAAEEAILTLADKMKRGQKWVKKASSQTF
jgi:hypothetical protein